MSHRSGCPGEAGGCHARTWGECARQARLAVQWTGGTSVSLGDVKAWDRENDYYARAVKDGLSPAGVERHQVDAAYEAAAKE